MPPIDLLLFIGGAFLDYFADKNPDFSHSVSPQYLFKVLFCPILYVYDGIPYGVLGPEGNSHINFHLTLPKKHFGKYVPDAFDIVLHHRKIVFYRSGGHAHLAVRAVYAEGLLAPAELDCGNNGPERKQKENRGNGENDNPYVEVGIYMGEGPVQEFADRLVNVLVKPEKHGKYREDEKKDCGDVLEKTFE